MTRAFCQHVLLASTLLLGACRSSYFQGDFDGELEVRSTLPQGTPAGASRAASLRLERQGDRMSTDIAGCRLTFTSTGLAQMKLEPDQTCDHSESGMLLAFEGTASTNRNASIVDLDLTATPRETAATGQVSFRFSGRRRQR
jgi:hypothetical protein